MKQKRNSKIKLIINDNRYMMIGCYGILLLLLISLCAHWLIHEPSIVTHVAMLPPAWSDSGDINYILGTDQFGQDIFHLLLISYKTTLIISIKTMIYVIITALILNYLLFFIPSIRGMIIIFFRLIIAIPPLLGAIVITLLVNDKTTPILFIVGLTYLPRFVHNIHEQILQEWNKTYITTYRLDGLSKSRILNFYMIPNILPVYLTELTALFSYTILTLTILTFLGFATAMHTPDLGIMMQQMLTIIDTNYWAFITPGIVIILTIIIVNLLNIGINLKLSKRLGN